MGNQTNRSNYGFDSFIRPQRLVVSYVYDLPCASSKLWPNAIPLESVAAFGVKNWGDSLQQCYIIEKTLTGIVA